MYIYVCTNVRVYFKSYSQLQNVKINFKLKMSLDSQNHAVT